MTTPLTTQVLQPQGHTRSEMRWRLSRIRGKRVPPQTLDRWLNELCIEPNTNGFYDDADLQILTNLIVFLKRCRSLDKFKQLLLEELNNAEHRKTDPIIETTVRTA